MIEWRNEYGIRIVYYNIYDKNGKSMIYVAFEYLFVFFQNLIGYAKCVCTIKKAFPYLMIRTSPRDTLYQRICIKDNSFHKG